jgi:hypothetical protein
MNNQTYTLKEVIDEYRADNDINDTEWYGLCKHYTRGTNPDLDTIRYYLLPYFRTFPKEQATDELIKAELFNFIEKYNK